VGHREDLLAAARRCLETRGYARTTARDLVAESGTNLASIGYHFGSKEALLNQAMGESFLEWAERVRSLALAIEPSGDPVSELASEPMSQRPRTARELASVPSKQRPAKPAEHRGMAAGGAGAAGKHSEDERLSMLAASWEAMLASFAEYRGLAVAFTEALAQAERQPALRAQLAAIYEQSRAAVAAMISEAMGLPDGAQARALATFQIVVCDGLLVQWLLDPDAAPSGAELTAALRLALG
jgi:AcrR family transcriptional regulator